MTCESNWTIRFPQVNDGEPFEIWPTEMRLRQERRKFDHLRAQFPWEVGEEMKPHTRYPGGELRSEQRVQVCYNGEPVQVMLFQPDNVNYTEDATHLELVDLQKAMDTGVVDKHWSEVKLKDAYRYAYNVYKDAIDKTSKGTLIEELKFTLPEELKNEKLIGQAELEPDDGGLFGTDFSIKELEGVAGTINEWTHPVAVAAIEANDTKRLVDSYYAVDFDKVSPIKAFWQLNEQYRLMSWVDSDGILWVGTPETTTNRHIAAQDDSRAWYFSNASISHPREPVKNVVVEGRWVDESGAGGVDDTVAWFNPLDGGDGPGDVRATGVATRNDIDYGLTFTKKNTGAKRNALDTVAKLALREEMKQQNSGTVEIDPDLSGDFTAVENVSLGDFIQLIPSDQHFENPSMDSGLIGKTPPEIKREACGNFVHNEIYTITGVTHKVVPDGGWTIELDVAMYPDVPIESFVRYFDPQSEQYLSENQVYDGDWIE